MKKTWTLDGVLGMWTMTVALQPAEDGPADPDQLWPAKSLEHLAGHFTDVVSLHEFCVDD